jgi:hypothetical protein
MPNPSDGFELHIVQPQAAGPACLPSEPCSWLCANSGMHLRLFGLH